MGSKGSGRSGARDSTRSMVPKNAAVPINNPSTRPSSVSISAKENNGQGVVGANSALPSGTRLDSSPGALLNLELSQSSHLPNRKQSTNLTSSVKNISTTSSSEESDGKTEKHESIATSSSTQPAETKWKPDIYVNNFVPRAYTAVNNSPALIRTTDGAESIDFKDYIRTFAGNYFLPELTAATYLLTNDRKESLASVQSLEPGNYNGHFLECLIRDNEAQSSAIRSYDLFGVSLQVSDASQNMFALHVPGIREGAPMISYDDEIMLRQLRLDYSTRLPLNMEAWLAPGGGAETGEIAPGFTGYQISAVVMAVHKSVETIILKVHGILPGTLIFNVRFVVQARLVKSLQRAVSSISHGLAAAQPMPSSNEGNINAQATTSAPRKDYGAIGKPVISQKKDTAARDSTNDWLRCMLFPAEEDGIWQETLPSGKFRQKWVDQTLNYEQKKAIDAIHSKSYGNLPFIIHGPPGTGKTKTMCETVRQLTNDPEFHGAILLCAPSDPAADTLALRLRAQFRPTEMLRLNDYSRTFAEVPQELMAYCYVDREIFNLPPFPTLMAYKIVITTCRAADALIQARLTNKDLASLERTMESIIHPHLGQQNHSKRSPTLHWAALLIDEAAQATEPEILIPLSVLAPPTWSDPSSRPIFALAGDHHQLSPRTHDKSSALHVSLFERLSSLPVYARHPFSRRNVKKTTSFRLMLRPAFANLTRNYRSHPAILAVSSTLFYNDTLIPEATEIGSLVSWSAWRGRGWPVLFACNGGIDTCEDVQAAGGGGWYNMREATKAIAYAAALLSSGLITTQSEICIMAPFDTQVRMLRTVARAQNLWGVNIGPVEAFQGLESRVVIFCTTRTRARFVSADGARGVGIMGEAKKFNVGITRAREGLIVLGNPHVLAQDTCWRAFLAFCWRNGLWEDDDNPGNRASSAGTVLEAEGNVNEWAPGPEDAAACGLEKALLHRDRGSDGNASSAAKRFLGESETDASWRMGLEAEDRVREEDDG